jgi:hypothetical protein
MKNPVSTQVTYNGVGGLTILGVIFVLAKLFGLITWSWWLVLLPFYLGMAIIVAVVVIMIGVALCMGGMAVSLLAIAAVLEWWEARKWRKNRAKNRRV